MKSSALIRMIEKDGWYIVRTKGSLHHFKHPRKKGRNYIASQKGHSYGNGKIYFEARWIVIIQTVKI